MQEFESIKIEGKRCATRQKLWCAWLRIRIDLRIDDANNKRSVIRDGARGNG
jgi:hypothetical protein